VQPGDLVADRFLLERVAGAGGMGTVYRAEDKLIGGPAAIKVLSCFEQDSVARFSREAILLAELRHPAIVKYLGHGFERGEPWLAMEWLDGESLEQRLERGRLTVEETVTFGLRVAEALAASHAMGIVHRDLKPANLFLVNGSLDRVRVLDFGVARLVEGGRLTKTGMMMGTPLYMAPEQARGLASVDARADVFGLGCVLYRCATGEVPFYANDLTALLYKIALDPPTAPRKLLPEIPLALEDLLLRMLAKSPDDRPSDGARLVAELAPIAHASSPPPAVQGRRTISARERRVSAALLLRFNEPSPVKPGATLRMTLATTAPMARRAPTALDTFLQALDRAEGRLDPLSGGTCAITFPSAGAAHDQASRAAQAALSAMSSFTAARAVIVAGRNAGAAVGVGVAQLDATQTGVVVDASAVGLLEPRWVIDRSRGVPRLVGPRTVDAPSRGDTEIATPTVGREHEIALISAVLEDCILEERAGTAVVLGPLGIGKARLAREVVARARVRFPNLNAIATRVDGLVGGDLGVTRETILAAANEGPTVIVIEDVERADPSALRALHVALRDVADKPVLALLLARPSLLDRAPRLFDGRSVQQVTLRELGRVAAGELVRGLLRGAREDIVAWVLARAGGHPLRLEESALALAVGAGEEPTEALAALVEGELDAIGLDARRVLRAAACAGDIFTPNALAPRVGDAGLAAAWLPTLLEAGLLREHQGAYRLRDSLLRAVALATIPEEERWVV
jgi:hypothetical protein